MNTGSHATGRGSRGEPRRAPMERSSQSSLSAMSWRPSSSALRPVRMVLSLECDAEIDGSRSSSPAPSLRSSPWRALEGAPHACALASASSRRSSASCSASSKAAAARRCEASPLLEPGLEPSGLWLPAEDELPPAASLATWSDIFSGDLRLRFEAAALAARERLGGAGGGATGSFSRARLLRVRELREHAGGGGAQREQGGHTHQRQRLIRPLRCSGGTWRDGRRPAERGGRSASSQRRSQAPPWGRRVGRESMHLRAPVFLGSLLSRASSCLHTQHLGCERSGRARREWAASDRGASGAARGAHAYSLRTPGGAAGRAGTAGRLSRRAEET